MSPGYIRQLPNRRYALGPRLIRLGEAANKQLGSLARPQLKSLVDRLGETANMAVLDSDMVIYVAQVPSLHSMRMITEVGKPRLHARHRHGQGDPGPAGRRHGPRHRGAQGMPTPTPKSISNVEALFEDLELIRQRGYSVDEEEQELGVRCFAMAIPDAPTPAAISVSGPVSRVDQAFADKAVPLLREAARRSRKSSTKAEPRTARGRRAGWRLSGATGGAHGCGPRQRLRSRRCVAS